MPTFAKATREPVCTVYGERRQTISSKRPSTGYKVVFAREFSPVIKPDRAKNRQTFTSSCLAGYAPVILRTALNIPPRAIRPEITNKTVLLRFHFPWARAKCSIRCAACNGCAASTSSQQRWPEQPLAVSTGAADCCLGPVPRYYYAKFLVPSARYTIHYCNFRRTFSRRPMIARGKEIFKSVHWTDLVYNNHDLLLF